MRPSALGPCAKHGNHGAGLQRSTQLREDDRMRKVVSRTVVFASLAAAAMACGGSASSTESTESVSTSSAALSGRAEGGRRLHVGNQYDDRGRARYIRAQRHGRGGLSPHRNRLGGDVRSRQRDRMASTAPTRFRWTRRKEASRRGSRRGRSSLRTQPVFRRHGYAEPVRRPRREVRGEPCRHPRRAIEGRRYRRGRSRRPRHHRPAGERSLVRCSPLHRPARRWRLAPHASSLRARDIDPAMAHPP